MMTAGAGEEVHPHEGRDQDESGPKRGVRSGDRRLQRVGDQEDEHEVEQRELADLSFAEQAQGDEQRQVDQRRA